MRKIFWSFIFSLFIIVNSFGDTYPEVIFDNSLIKGTYAKSKVGYIGESWVENVNKHLLVSDSLFFTPGNSLSLKYLSSNKGVWKVDIRYSRQKVNYELDKSNFLSLRLYVSSPKTKKEDLPKITITQARGYVDTLSMDRYIEDFQIGTWLQVKIPCKDFSFGKEHDAITGVSFIQSKTSDIFHHVFLDQIEFLPERYSQAPLVASAFLVDAKSIDRSVQLKWQLPLTPSIRYVKIYRAIGDQEFKAIGIKPIYMQSCLDMVPDVGGVYKYKITWLNYDYKESGFSAIKEVKPQHASDSAIIDLVQQAHINYFVENYDINSGMYMPYRSKDKAVVSTKETANSIYALLIGVDKKLINKQTALQRISKVTYFLLKGQHKNGVFPGYFDGRKGVPEYRRGVATYDVSATATLLEALLVAREYFSAEDPLEKDLRARITALYNQVKWNELVLDKYPTVLKRRISLVEENKEEFNRENVVYGLNDAINTYMLAIAAPKNALDSTAYFNGVFNSYKYEKNQIVPNTEELVYADTIDQTEEILKPQISVSVDTLMVRSLLDTTYHYGVKLNYGELNESLLGLVRPFFTVKPSLLNDSLNNWNTTLINYTNYVKRRDNEVGVGSTNSDIWGFYQHRDTTGNYRINPAISISSIIVDQNLGIQALLSLYKQYGDILFTEYGFRSWLDLRDEDVSDEYMAANQGAVIVALENYKSGLIWDLYQKIPELKRVREKLFLKE